MKVCNVLHQCKIVLTCAFQVLRRFIVRIESIGQYNEVIMHQSAIRFEEGIGDGNGGSNNIKMLMELTLVPLIRIELSSQVEITMKVRNVLHPCKIVLICAFQVLRRFIVRIESIGLYNEVIIYEAQWLLVI
ncbi:hypothetical protein BLOT_010748, partial [Blomia tropicalis]